MKILLFYPSNKRTIAFNSLMKGLKDKGNDMYLLTTCEEGILHEDLNSLGVKVFSNPMHRGISIFFYLKQAIYLIKFCNKHKIDVVLSNLQQANIIAVFAQYFMKSAVSVFRHHFHYVHLLKADSQHEFSNRNEALFDKIINRRSKKIIVPSYSVKQGMVDYEKVNPDKIEIMQYLYDFSYYALPGIQEVEALKAKYKAHLVILMCSRLIKLKQHHVVFPVFKKLIIENKYDLKIIVLDDGPEKESLESYVKSNSLEDHIFFVGYTDQIQNYMACSDVMVHPSLTEASNSAVKEMALQGKVSIVCENVGDFSDYLVNKKNGFLISAADIQNQLEKTLSEIYEDKSMLKEMGEMAKESVVSRFSVSDQNLDKYISLIVTK